MARNSTLPTSPVRIVTTTPGQSSMERGISLHSSREEKLFSIQRRKSAKSRSRINLARSEANHFPSGVKLVFVIKIAMPNGCPATRPENDIDSTVLSKCVSRLFRLEAHCKQPIADEILELRRRELAHVPVPAPVAREPRHEHGPASPAGSRAGQPDPGGSECPLCMSHTSGYVARRGPCVHEDEARAENTGRRP
jgi:hypothetical protein